MKNNLNSHQNDCRLPGFKTANFAGLALAAALALATISPAQGQAGTNLLVNPCFSANNGNKVPTGWSRFVPPEPGNPHTNDYWIENNEATPICGTEYWKEWGAGYFPAPTNNVAGIYQEFGSSPGSVYNASGWFYTKTNDIIGNPTFNSYAWIDVSFLDAGGNLLALYTSGDFSELADPGGSTNWFQYEVTNACDLSSPVATGDPYFTNYAVTGQVTQLVAPAGTVTVRYRFAYLQANNESGSCYFDEAALDQTAGPEAPVITNILPQNMIFYPQSNGFNFVVFSPSGSTINHSGIHLSLNGVDVSSSLAFSGSSSSNSVSYQGLQSNTTYNATITVTDVDNLSASFSTYFETTWVGIPPISYLWEAEDFDFSSGMYIDFPDLCNASGDPNCYYGTVGTPYVDEYYANNPNESVSHLYRALDQMNIDTSGDYLRENLFNADRTDYAMNPFENTEWVNYTRNFSNGTYWVIARLATDVGLSGSETMSVVNSDGTLTDLGTFKMGNGLGWTTFSNVFLLDTTGNRANVTLNGVTTLQVTSGGNLLPNFFALIPEHVVLSGMYPDGGHPLEYTNALTFTVTTVGATFPANSIKVNLDGFDVSSALVISGSASDETVVYPDLLPNAIHTAIITATNSLGRGVAVTNQFDTFNGNNFMVEASDFDFNGGQFITNNASIIAPPYWYPNAYEYYYVATTNIDFQHTILGCESNLYYPDYYPYPNNQTEAYRPNGIPTQPGSDYLTPIFVSDFGTEFDLGCFGPGDWANYTRIYPTGNFFVYMRTAGLGPFSMYLEQVVSGATTTNQVVQQLGYWGAVGVNDATYSWVPLTDAGLVAPVVVSLNGLETLRITTPTGDCYPNYFMLVPASGISLSAARSGSNAVISFPSQVGVVYSVFSRAALASGNWNFLTNVLGTGGVVPVSIPATTAAQFYEVLAP